ncbi:MAG: arsenite methyltransferase [Calditrichaeota bacterium]|nr:arsenite methyltransferase [Calditrichota bacterium]MCB0295776.1 arsenite methyltransferase [Calditrichota bacterium]
MKKQNWSDEEIKKEIQQQYGALVDAPGKSSCCGPASSCCSPADSMKGKAVKVAGYSDTELASLPAEAVENSFGCGNPLAFAGVQPGQTVVDIGSGAGIDCFLAAEKVGPAGKVIGIDMTPAMIAKARANAAQGGYAQVDFRQGEAEAMPVDDVSADWVISNCVINLAPDKSKVFREIARVLKPGGQFSISDIVLGDDLPDAIADNIMAWTGCVAGAIRESDYLQGLREAGIREVAVEDRLVYDEDFLRGFIADGNFPLGIEDLEPLLKQMEGKIWSARIVGTK